MNVSGSPPSPETGTIGYCTNVHAGVDLAAIRDNLQRYSVPIRDAVGATGDLGVGLWLPEPAAVSLAAGSQAEQFRQFLADRQLRPFTINGFPYDNFHQPVVKRRVYRPAWWRPERLEYTRHLAEILAVLLPEDEAIGSISTLPIGWPSDIESPDQLATAGAHLRQLADHLVDVRRRTGREIVVAIEPEPGCLLQTTDDVLEWFEEHLPEEHHRRHITVCHDICHSAVMMEPQAEVLSRLARANIGIGKVQVSCAIVADWQSMAEQRRREAVDQLRQFAEDRYLHQTGRRTASGAFELAEDLPSLIADGSGNDPVGDDSKWIVHFHVPIFLDRFGHLTTSQQDVIEALRTLSTDRASDSPRIQFSGHLEIETYAWSVLPESMRRRGLAEDVAQEFRWLHQALVESESPDATHP